MPKGRILKIKPGHEANCSSHMYAFHLMVYGAYALVPLATITTIIHSLRAGTISQRPLMDRKNLRYLIIPQCVGLLFVAGFLGLFVYGANNSIPMAIIWVVGSFATLLLIPWGLWLVAHRFIPKAAGAVFVVLMCAIVVGAGHLLGLVAAVPLCMSMAFLAVVSLSYRLAWRIGPRPLVVLVVLLAPLVGVTLFAGLLYPINPVFVKRQAYSAGLWDPRPTLHAAAMKNDMETVRKLLESGTDVNLKASDGKTALFMASEDGSVEMVRFLLERGANPEIRDLEGNIALSEVAWKGHTEVARLLLDKGGDPNAKIRYGKTVLLQAAWGGRLDIVRLLLTRGADVNPADDSGTTALMDACSRISDPPRPGEGANGKPESRDVREIRRQITKERRDRTEIVALLMEKGADVHAKSNDGKTALLKAAGHGYTEVVQLLLERGADVNAKTTYGPTTPLNEAAKAGYADIVRLLLEKGATEPTEPGVDELTALGKASIEGHTEVVALLKAAGAKDLGPGFDASSWEKAVFRDDLKKMEELLDRGFDANAKLFYRGRTALVIASEEGKSDMARLLLKKGADVNIKTDEGETALSMADQFGRTELVELLKAHGAKK